VGIIWIIIREFLILIVSLILGFFLLTFFPFNDTSPNVQNKKRLYTNYSNEFNFSSYLEFSKALDDSIQRKVIYDIISKKYDIGNFKNFEQSVLCPSVSQNFISTFKNLFEERVSLILWYILFSPYILFQLFRGLLRAINSISKSRYG
jgi:hypothetical protein